jgi:tetratricopeptide (TPR) repeat protein
MNAALHPICEAFRKVFAVDTRAPIAVQRASLVAALQPHRLPSKAQTLFEMALGMPADEAAVPLNMSPQRQKQATLEAFTTLMLALSEKRPLVLFVEDLHWIDPSSLELLSMFIEHCSAANVLGIFTSRPEFANPWGSRSNFTQLSLTRLSPKRSESMIRELLAGRQLPTHVLQQLQAKTDGIPLFIEELTRAVAESAALESSNAQADTLSVPELAIPATLRDSLTARLDRLGPAKSTAQLAATIGREFSYDLLACISPLPDETLRSHLRKLVEDELIFQRGMFPKTVYSFKHSLIQEAAYESLLKKVRREAHAHIVSALKESFPELAAAQPEVLAHHAEHAGLVAESVQCLVQAGQQALQRSGLRESISYLSHALQLLAHLPLPEERLQLEIAVRTTLGIPLMFSKGYGAPEVEENYARALTIDRDLGGKQPLSVLWGLWIFHHVRGHYQAAYGISEQLLMLAREQSDSNVAVCAHLAHGSTSLLLGKFADARKHLERTIELYEPNVHGFHAHLFGQDPSMFSHAMLSWTLWFLGYPDQARAAAEASLQVARRAMHPNTLGFALSLKAALHQLCGDARVVLEHTEELLKLCNEQGLGHWGGLGQMLHGWARIECNGAADVDSALQQMLDGRRTWQAIGARVADTHWESMLAEVHENAGHPGLGQEILAHTLSFMDQSNERYFEPELQRLKAELALKTSGDVARAKADFAAALDLAKKSGAKSLALRAAMSLYRLDLQEHARITLASCVESFTEGFDTRDLRCAASLLADAGHHALKRP